MDGPWYTYKRAARTPCSPNPNPNPIPNPIPSPSPNHGEQLHAGAQARHEADGVRGRPEDVGMHELPPTLLLGGVQLRVG